MPAAIANAVFHTTGTRVRNLQITPDNLLQAARGAELPLGYRSRVIGGASRAAALLLCAVSVLAMTRPSPSPTPTSLELIRARVASDAVVGADPSLHFVIALRLVDTHEAFTITLHGERLDVAEGLPRSASVALSGRRSTMINIFRGRETISGAVRRNLVDVRGDMDRLFQLFECCVRPRPTPTPTATAR